MQEHNNNAIASMSLGETYATHPESVLDTGNFIRFVLKGCSYAVYGLMVVVDGLNNPESFPFPFSDPALSDWWFGTGAFVL